MSKRVHERGWGIILGTGRVWRQIRDKRIDRAIIIKVGRRVGEDRIRWRGVHGIFLLSWEDVKGSSPRGRRPSRE